MIKLIRLILDKLFGGNNEHINGANLFADEYTTSKQFKWIPILYKQKPTIRMPFKYNEMPTFKKAQKFLYSIGIQSIALLDQYDSMTSMISRLKFIKDELPWIQYIELFNELPHMHYEGEQINNLQHLITTTNFFADWIHANMRGKKVITMAPYNSLDERSYPAWQGVTNTRILKDLVLYTAADIAAVHIYGDSIGKQMEMFTLADNLRKWNAEAKFKKQIWITETGDDAWSRHVPFYHNTIRLAANVLKPERIIWYRQTIKDINDPDGNFALEDQDTNQRSPLWNELV